MKAVTVTKALHSRATLVVTLAVMLVSSFYAIKQGAIDLPADDKGIVFPSPDLWMTSVNASFNLNVAALFLLTGLMIFINKAYNIPRTITLIYASSFAVLLTASPQITTAFGSGTMIALVVVASMLLMFSSYGLSTSAGRVFLVFFMLSGASAFQYAFVVYIPVFVIACAQMRVLTVRTVLATLLGIITPWWIMIGAGIVAPDAIHMPDFGGAFGSADMLDRLIIVITVGLTVLTALTAYMLSVLKLMTYNARMRACNGVLTLVTFATAVAFIADFGNYAAYLTLLDLCTAFFLGHLFVIRNNSRSWIVIISIFALYYALYIWRLIA